MAENFFPDQFAIEFIRTSLWNQAGSGASVMVGSGFSRNASPTSPSAREMPTWPQMAKSLCVLLYADASKESYERTLGEATSTSGFLRLAQEYKAAFGQTALNEQIRALVPDLEYDPGDLHEMLLQLPWTDVLTTNWDTLLERAALDVFDENYDVIRTHSEIASSTRPRIVKLHGTLPAHEPFIFTEDDYRTYPRLHAPFVNLVQQTLMESTLCLIGFSGDDPNFLHWSGWVRDNLGVNAPKIYLVGWLELTPSRRRMLEDRNVVPIDLSVLPSASKWPKELRHRYATEWFIESISVREKYRPEDWPHVDTEPRQFPVHLGHIAEPSERLPISEPFGPSGTGAFNTDTTELERIISTWNWNRALYPNWAIAPKAVRQRIWMHTYSWVSPIIRIQSASNPYLFLRALDELTWRLNVSLAPHLPELQQPIIDCLNCFNFSENTVSKSPEQPGFNEKIYWPDLRIIWTRVAMNLVQASRTRGFFADARKMLSTIETISLGILQNEIIYENLLIMRDSADLDNFTKQLLKWNVNGIDSIWAAKKAGLLAGVGHFNEAKNLVVSELSINRKNRRRDTVDYASYSREAWLLWIEDTLPHDNRLTVNVENFERRKFLVSTGCDVLRDFNDLVDRLAVEVNRKEKPKTGFYRRQAESIIFRNGLEDEIRTALEILQFQDKTGLPRSMYMTSVLGPGLRMASTVLQEREPYMSAMANIRGVDTPSDEKLDFWTRNRIARLSKIDFEHLYLIVFSEINFIFTTSGDLYNKRWHRQLQVLFEVLARLSIRFSNAQAEQILDMLLNVIKFDSKIQDPTLCRQLNNLLGNTFSSCSVEIIQKKILTIFSSSIFNDANLPEIIELVPSYAKFGDDFHNTREKNWDVIVDDLAEKILSDNENLFTCAHSRVRKLKELNILKPKEVVTLSNQFWLIKADNFTRWPMAKDHYPWANFFLPCVEPIRRNQFFKKIFLCNGSDSKTFSSIGSAGVVQKILEDQNEDLKFTLEELGALKHNLLKWITLDIVKPNDDLAEFFNPEINFSDNTFIMGLIPLIPDLNIEENELDLLFQKIKTNFKKFPVILKLLPYIASRLKKRLKEIEIIFRKILVSDENNMIHAACQALWHWLDQNKKGKILPCPPEDVMSDVSKIIGGRRMSGLIPALELGAWIVKNSVDEARKQVLRDAEMGMTLLSEDIQYDGSLAKAGVDVASVRMAVARFTFSVERFYYDAPEIFSRILESLANDEIVEVRNVALGVNIQE